MATDTIDDIGEADVLSSTEDGYDSALLTEEELRRREEERRQKQAEAEFEQRLVEEEQRLKTARAAGQPTGQGRMYMGPMISQEQFNRIPVGGNVNLAPPVTAPAMSELQRLQAADNPEMISRGSVTPVQAERTISVTPPGIPPVSDVNFDLVNQAMQARKRYEAQRGFLEDVQAGKDPAVSRAKWALDIFGAPPGTKPAAPAKPITHFGTRGGVTTVDPVTGKVTVLQKDEPLPIKYTGPMIEFRQNEFGPKMRGHSDEPEIKARLKLENDAKAKEAADAAAAANEPGFLSRLGKVLAPKPSGIAGGTPVNYIEPPVIAPPTSNRRTGREVQRRTKDGRIAIFDADTKEFLRYAD